MKQLVELALKIIGFMFILREILRPSFCVKIEVKPLPNQSTLFLAMVASLFMTVCQPIFHLNAAAIGCAVHICCASWFLSSKHDYAWAKNMKRLLQETCKKVSARKEKYLSDKELANLQKRYRNILIRGEKELPEIPPQAEKRLGKLARSDAHNLWDRFKKYEAAVLLFAKDPHVSFTNTRAERDLRMAKVKKKVSGCFRTSEYAHAYCKISSYLQSMASRGYNQLIAI